MLAGFRIGGKEASDKFMTDFRRARNETFRANYYENLAARAHADGLGWHSESGGPWIRTAPVFGEADQLEFLSDNDMPQGEFWVGTQFGGEEGRCGRYLVKPIANTANIYGKGLVAVEAFTHMNRHWSSYPALLKITADSAFADGANMIIWHTYTASPEKFGKPGIEYFAGTHINGNVTWHNMAAPFIEYLARCQYMLTRGKSVSDVCVYTGDTPYQHWGEWKDKPFKNSKLKIPAGFSYDIANNDVLLNRAKVENGRLDFGAGKTYSALIVDLESPLVSAKALGKSSNSKGGTSRCRRRQPARGLRGARRKFGRGRKARQGTLRFGEIARRDIRRAETRRRYEIRLRPQEGGRRRHLFPDGIRQRQGGLRKLRDPDDMEPARRLDNRAEIGQENRRRARGSGTRPRREGRSVRGLRIRSQTRRQGAWKGEGNRRNRNPVGGRIRARNGRARKGGLREAGSVERVVRQRHKIFLGNGGLQKLFRASEWARRQKAFDRPRQSPRHGAGVRQRAILRYGVDAAL